MLGDGGWRTAIGGSDPIVHDGGIGWSNPALGVEGRWTALDESIEQTVFESAEGRVHWRCLQPRSRVKLRVGGREVSGLGYAEHVVLTIAPWDVPLRTLQWGRFVHESGYLVWIHWDDRKLCWSSDDDVTIADLHLAQTRTLRDGPLGSAALASAPGLRSTLPARMLAVHETKRISRARLIRGPHAGAEGWAIHEVVEWPRD